MNVHVLSIPYDSGHAATRMGRGPGAFLSGGLPGRLRDSGHTVEVVAVESRQRLPAEIGTAFELNRELAGRVRAATGKGAFPLVLTGNCIACLGTIAGVGSEGLGVLWLDAHGDFHTPETTASGFLDGMALAIATGECWRTAAGTVPGFAPVAARDVLLVGARAFDSGERERFEAGGGAVLDPVSIRSGGTRAALAHLRQRVERLYVHLDLDVLDPGEGRANAYAAPGGLSRGELHEILLRVRTDFTVEALALTAYDPAEDPHGGIRETGIAAAHALLEPRTASWRAATCDTP